MLCASGNSGNRMALFEITGDQLKPIPERTFTELGLLERAHIQRAIRSHVEAITPGVSTMVLAEEFSDWDGPNRRIDLLCLDSEARLVVVELKRDNAAHMELQALRYAAMISAMRFDQAVEAHRAYLRSIGSSEDPEERIRAHLGLGDSPGALSEDVRIVLAALDFPQELTTAVLWLNKQGLDLRCVQMRPHLVDGRVLVDIQQVIPLPSAAEYQVALREKENEQNAARSRSSRDFTRYDLTIGETTIANLSKRRLAYEVVAEAVRRGVPVEEICSAIPWRGTKLFMVVTGAAPGAAAVEGLLDRGMDRYFAAEDELLTVDGTTYALSNQWGHRTIEAVQQILKLMPAGPAIEFAPTSPICDEAAIDGMVIRQRESGTIEVEQDGAPVEPAMPVLRTLAGQLGVPLTNGRGGEMNTRQLGAQVIRAVLSARNTGP